MSDATPFDDWDPQPLPPEPTSPLARAKARTRGEGWTITGNRRAGYTVRQLGTVEQMTLAQLFAFAGMENIGNV